MKTEFIPVDYGYFDFEGRNYVKLVGRNEKGSKICVVDSYEPNFWVILKDSTPKKRVKEIIEKIKKIEVEKGPRVSRVEKTEVKDKNYLGEKVQAIQVFVTNHKDLHDVASEIGDVPEIIARREYDISIITKYIKEKNVEPLVWQSIEGNILDTNEFGGLAGALDVDICIYAEEIKTLEKQKKFEPKILSYDIETDEVELGKGNILMVSLYGKNLKKVFSWKKCKDAPDYLVSCSDEGEMLEAFAEEVRKQDPDILTGYFSDGFDLPYLVAKAQVNKINLVLGIDGKKPSFQRGRIPSGKITGVIHVDLYRFIDAVFSQYLQSETLSLNEVASELIGEKKEDFDFAKLPNMAESDWKDFFSYNLQDARVTYKLAEKILPDMLEFVKIIKEPLFDVTRDRMSSHVENYLIHNLDKFNEIIEKRPTHGEIGGRKEKGKYEGAFVFEPTPGLYKNLVMFDFTSMYASVIVSYNLSKSTFIGDETTSVSDALDKFKKDRGFFPEMLLEIIDKRKKYKKEYAKDKNNMKKARSNAYKLLANAAYGYQGFFGARYYCREAAAATAAFAKKNILEVIEKIKKEGCEVIYSDTDSVALLQGNKSKKQIFNMLKEFNKKLPGIMELDLEDFYPRGLFVSKRRNGGLVNSKEKIIGAKKKYALLDEEGKIKIRGFETVRRDWCRLSRDLQNKVLRSILNDGNEKVALEILKEALEKLKTRKIPIKDLMIRTQLKKPINEYLSEGPHVVAAKKMEERGILISVGMLVEYFIGETRGKSANKRVGDRVFLPEEKTKYDIDYYVNKQIIPAIENIFEVLGVNVREIAEGEKQEKLF